MKKKRAYLIVIFLIIACCIAFGRIVGNDFINLDDPGYITENYHVQSGISLKNIQWAFTTIVLSNWHPLTLISHMLDWSLFGANASGHHLVSLLLHIGAVIFLFLFLNKTTNSLWPSAFAAALFALHPLRVESVAWAAERKDVLSMFFGMAALYAYAFYAESSKYSRYFICLILFTLSLMSKPMLVTLPFVLLLLDYWPLGRWQKVLSISIENRYHFAGKLVWEKAPFFIFITLSIGLTLWSQRTGIASLDRLPIVDRAMNAILSYLYYIDKFVYPVDLAVFYPYPNYVSLWQVSVASLLLFGISIAVIYTSKKAPFLFVGWFWYLGTLIPVIGLVQVGDQAMADRYTYLPSIGIAIMLTWGIPLLFRHKDIRKKALFPVGVAVIATLTFLSWMQCGYWKNSFTLFGHALDVTKNNYLAHNRLASALSHVGKNKEAIYHFNQSINAEPKYIPTYIHKGVAYIKLGQYHLAIECFNEANRRNPYNAEAYNKRGFAYLKLRQFQRAIEDYNQAITNQPDYADAYYNRAVIYFTQGHKNLGCLDAKKACELGNCKILKSAKDKGYCR
jgi:tetratricopeptide (TPR) repeat protein